MPAGRHYHPHLVPDMWGALLLAAIAFSVWGLIRDFNTTPEPVVETHDPRDEHDLPDEVLSGHPPPVSTVAGRVVDDDPPAESERKQ